VRVARWILRMIRVFVIIDYTSDMSIDMHTRIALYMRLVSFDFLAPTDLRFVERCFVQLETSDELYHPHVYGEWGTFRVIISSQGYSGRR